jgi:hypothetical protein
VRCMRVVELCESDAKLIGDVTMDDDDNGCAVPTPVVGSAPNGACTNRRAFEQPIVCIYTFVLFESTLSVDVRSQDAYRYQVSQVSSYISISISM